MENDNFNETETKEIMLNPADFDSSRVIIHDAVTSTFKIGGSDISMTVSKAFYLDDEGHECKLYFSGPPQTCFGPQYQHEMNIKDEEKNHTNAKGVQIQYPLTSLQSISAPTPDEKAFQDMVQAIWKLSLEKGKEEMGKVPPQEDGADEINTEDYTSIPLVSYSSFLAASASNRWTNALKPAFEHPKDSKGNKKIVDTTKPKRMYIKLKTQGRGDKMRVLTPFYGPGDVKQSPLKYMEQRGIVTPCIEWEGIYWGGHGHQPHGASLRFFIVEANFVPISADGSNNLPKHRLLPKNTAASNISEEINEDDVEEGTFASPQTSSSSLSALAKANKAKNVPVPVPVAKGKTIPPVAKGKVAAPVAKGKAIPPPKAKGTISVVAPKGKVATPKGKVAAPVPVTKVVPKAKIPPKAKITPKPAPVEPEEEYIDDAEEEEVEDYAEVEEEDAEEEDANAEDEDYQ